MITTLEQFLSAWMQDAFCKALPGVDADWSTVAVVATTSAEFGDYQCNHAMGLAKTLKKAPRQIAEAVISQVSPHDAVEKVTLAGPGFINITIKSVWLAGQVTGLGLDARMGVPQVGQGKTVILDYSSPNVAKPMHIGHIRSTVIGNALDRMHRFLGYRVLSDNHLGDWGTQFGIMIMGYRHFADPKILDTEPVEELERVYVKSYERSKQDEAWLQQARQELVKLQAGDPENRKLWQQFVELSLSEFDHIYKRLDVKFDLIRGESFYNDRLAGVVQSLTEKGIVRESDGATVAFLDDEKLPPCIVKKSDGGFNYATTDLATIQSRVEEFHPDKIIYVTDERQQNHFKQVFAVARKMGCTTKLEHVWFGLMRLPEGTFSTRQGNVIKLEKYLDEAESRALAVVKETSPGMPEEHQRNIARAAGIGGVKYADLSQNPQSLVTFTWEKALALDGNSAPYLQYAYARIASVQDKYRDQFPATKLEDFPILLGEPIERVLAIMILRFPETVMRAAESYKPSVLADYLYELSSAYSTFYQNVPFLKAPEGLRESRVNLCVVVARILRQGLNLLGIETPDRI
ncbi:MAG: arginine--tRNA ligase [bacterium]